MLVKTNNYFKVVYESGVCDCCKEKNNKFFIAAKKNIFAPDKVCEKCLNNYYKYNSNCSDCKTNLNNITKTYITFDGSIQHICTECYNSKNDKYTDSFFSKQTNDLIADCIKMNDFESIKFLFEYVNNYSIDFYKAFEISINNKNYLIANFFAEKMKTFGINLKKDIFRSLLVYLEQNNMAIDNLVEISKTKHYEALLTVSEMQKQLKDNFNLSENAVKNNDLELVKKIIDKYYNIFDLFDVSKDLTELNKHINSFENIVNNFSKIKENLEKLNTSLKNIIDLSVFINKEHLTVINRVIKSYKEKNEKNKLNLSEELIFIDNFIKLEKLWINKFLEKYENNYNYSKSNELIIAGIYKLIDYSIKYSKFEITAYLLNFLKEYNIINIEFKYKTKNNLLEITKQVSNKFDDIGIFLINMNYFKLINLKKTIQNKNYISVLSKVKNQINLLNKLYLFIFSLFLLSVISLISEFNYEFSSNKYDINITYYSITYILLLTSINIFLSYKFLKNIVFSFYTGFLLSVIGSFVLLNICVDDTNYLSTKIKYFSFAYLILIAITEFSVNYVMRRKIIFIKVLILNMYLTTFLFYLLFAFDNTIQTIFILFIEISLLEFAIIYYLLNKYQFNRNKSIKYILSLILISLLYFIDISWVMAIILISMAVLSSMKSKKIQIFLFLIFMIISGIGIFYLNKIPNIFIIYLIIPVFSSFFEGFYNYLKK